MPAEKAPCFYALNPPLTCPLDFNGKVPVTDSCTQYFFCYENEIIGFYECTGGFHFSEANQTCEAPTDCVEPTIAGIQHSEKKLAKNFVDYILRLSKN